MPLIVLSGWPCSGKTTLATCLHAHISSVPSNTCTIISELPDTDYCGRGETVEQLAGGPDKLSGNSLQSTHPASHFAVGTREKTFSSARSEKIARDRIKSRLTRDLNPKPSSWWVVDASNYVRGFRYEIHCLAKNRRCKQATVHCVSDTPDSAWRRNCVRASGGEDSYSRDVFEALVSRYEEPGDHNRCDRPLYRLNVGDSSACDMQVFCEHLVSTLVCDSFSGRGLQDSGRGLQDSGRGQQDSNQVNAAVCTLEHTETAVRPNRSSQSFSATESKQLDLLALVCHRVTCDLIDSLAQQPPVCGATVPLDACTVCYVAKEVTPTPADLWRVYRQFIVYARAHPLSDDKAAIADVFVQYLNGHC